MHLAERAVAIRSPVSTLAAVTIVDRESMLWALDEAAEGRVLMSG